MAHTLSEKVQNERNTVEIGQKIGKLWPLETRDIQKTTTHIFTNFDYYGFLQSRICTLSQKVQNKIYRFTIGLKITKL